MPRHFTGPKIFCAGPNILSQRKNLTAFSASSKNFVLAQKPILLKANHLFVWHKKFGPVQNILGPVKGHGIRGFPKLEMSKCGDNILILSWSSCQFANFAICKTQ